MRSGRLHIGGFSTGPTPFAVNLAGAVPFALMGSDDGRFGYTLQVYTRKDSGINEMADLKGKRVAHTAPTSKRSEEQTSELQSLMRISYADFGLKKKKKHKETPHHD